MPGWDIVRFETFEKTNQDIEGMDARGRQVFGCIVDSWGHMTIANAVIDGKEEVAILVSEFNDGTQEYTVCDFGAQFHIGRPARRRYVVDRRPDDTRKQWKQLPTI